MKLQLLILCCILESIIGGKLTGYEVGHPPLTGRIVGGAVAEDGIAPYQCSIQQNGRHNCGCAIISKKWVLTASHCIQTRPENIKILVGTNDLKNGGKQYPVSKLIPHEEYNKPSFANDVGLILIDGEIEFNEKVQPIKYSNKFVKAGTKLRVTGWGRLSAGGAIPQLLQVLDVNAISNQECKSYHGATVHDSHICTFTKRGEGVCSGDSGGPLVLDGEVVGLANWAVLCARGYPDGFARVSYLYDWIKSHTEA